MRLLAPALALACLAQAAPAATPGDWLRGMAAGLEALGNAVDPAPHAPPDMPTHPAWPGWPQTVPAPAPPAAPAFDPWPVLRRLEGAWKTDSGALLLVRGDKARFHLDRRRHQDLLLQVDPYYLWLRPPGAERASRYAYRLEGDRLELRDAHGRVLRLRRHLPATPPASP